MRDKIEEFRQQISEVKWEQTPKRVKRLLEMLWEERFSDPETPNRDRERVSAVKRAIKSRLKELIATFLRGKGEEKA
jgi:hypothetical protein